MPLTGKYLAYNKLITFEIFKQIWNKLIECKWNCSSNIEHVYQDFCGKYNYLVQNKNDGTNDFKFLAYNKKGVEITVQEILGYDPFVKEEVVPEYVECIEKLDGIEIGKIYKIENDLIAGTYKWEASQFAPSTKEAFDAQSKPKSIEKWSVGTYVLFLKDLGHFKAGYIDIINDKFDGIYASLEKYLVMDIKRENDGEVKWFATKSEAEEFARILINPIKSNEFPSDGCCKSKSNELEQYLIKTRGNSDSKMAKDRANGIGWNESSYWWLLDTDKSSKRQYHLSDLEIWLDKPKEIISLEYQEVSPGEFKPKQPLKQAVHCKTQEEWDFVCDKINHKFYHKFNVGYHDTIDIINLKESFKSYYKDYQILSFQEWCDLNGYKMGEKAKFEVGKWYKYENWYLKYLKHDNGIWIASEHITDTKSYSDFKACFGRSNLDSEKVLASIEEIQQYLPDNHPDKIKSNQEFKVGDWVIANFTGWNDTNHKQFKTIYKQNELMQIKSFSKMSNGQDFNVAITYGGNVIYIDKYREKFRHATPGEINNHLISIGQIPAGEPLNSGVEPDKDGMFKYTTVPGTSFGNNYSSAISYSNSSSKPKMTLSIDDEELPMVNIIKTKTVNLLNLE